MPADPDASWQELDGQFRDLGGQDLPDDEWVARFLRAVGSDPDQFPPEMLALAVPLVPVFRRGPADPRVRGAGDHVGRGPVPQARRVRRAQRRLRRHVRRLARHIGADHAVIEGAGHEIQFTGEPINQTLLSVWRTTSA